MTSLNRLVILTHLTGPIQIRIYGKVGHHFEENYFFSDGMYSTPIYTVKELGRYTINANTWLEPGFYQENEFGIRLESILRVINKTFEVFLNNACHHQTCILEHLLIYF